MWESGDGRGTLPAGGNTFAPGDRVIALAAPGRTGVVASVGRRTDGCLEIVWSTEHGAVVWPVDEDRLRKALPWE